MPRKIDGNRRKHKQYHGITWRFRYTQGMSRYHLVPSQPIAYNSSLQQHCHDLGVLWDSKRQRVARAYDLARAKRLKQAFARRGITFTIIDRTTGKQVASPAQVWLGSSPYLMRINIALCIGLLLLLGSYFFLAPYYQNNALPFGSRPVIKDTTNLVASAQKRALVPRAPQQELLNEPQQWHYATGRQKYQIEAVARYQLEARVLSKKRYRYDRSAALAPWDMVLGWQEMSDSNWLQHVSIDQRNRWYYWRATDAINANSDIALRSANVHMIPASRTVRQSLNDIRPHQLVRFEGFLVNVESANGRFTWRTSLARDDEGLGACELFWVTDVRILPQNYFVARGY